MPALGFEQVADRVWVHTSWLKYPQGWFPSNGLVVQGPRGVLLVDTAWTPPQTVELIDRIERVTGSRPLNLVVTHAHDDRMGGLSEVHARNCLSLAHEETARFAHKQGLATNFTGTWPGEIHTLTDTGRTVELFYPGAAHSPDNTVAFIEDVGVLFGGCMIRGAEQAGLGNTTDADLCHWPVAARAVQERYGERASIIIPGHGKPGPASLLSHTVALAEAAQQKPCG